MKGTKTKTVFPDIIISEIKKINKISSLKKLRQSKKNEPQNNDTKDSNIFCGKSDEKRFDNSKSFVSIKMKFSVPNQIKQTRMVFKDNTVSIKPAFFQADNSNEIGSVLPKKYQKISNLTKPKNAENDLKNKTLTTENFFSVIKDTDDPFFYGNIVKNINFSTFKNIIDGNAEHGTVSYPFIHSKSKVISRYKPNSKPRSRKITKVANCKCLDPSEKKNHLFVSSEEIRESLPFLREVKKVIQTLYRILFFPQKAKCFKNVIIINFENTFGLFKSSLSKKKGTWKVIRKLAGYFQVVLILYEKKNKDVLLQVIESKKVHISGLYVVNERAGIMKRCRMFIDYSQIYYDYEVTSPQSNCLVISSHSLYELEGNYEDAILDKSRPWPNLLVSGVPVASYEYFETPCCLVVNSIKIEGNCNVFHKFLSDLDNFFINFRCFRDNLEFTQFFYRLGYKVVKSFKTQHLFLDFVDGHLLEKDYMNETSRSRQVTYCAVHSRYYKQYLYNKPVNHFIII